MVRSVAAGEATFAQASVFVLDEFGDLAPDNPGRAKHAVMRHLIGAVDLPAEAFHFLDPDASDIDEHCRRYDLEIGDGFDLVLLGIGLNGHLGMNEPGSPAGSRTRRVDLHETTIASAARYFSARERAALGSHRGARSRSWHRRRSGCSPPGPARRRSRSA